MMDTDAVATANAAAANADADADAEADALFRKHTVYEIRSIEKRTRYVTDPAEGDKKTEPTLCALRADIDRKKHELRMTVGERYRDLIEAADLITDMKTAIATVHSVLQDVRANSTTEQPRKLAASASGSVKSTNEAILADSTGAAAGISKQQAYLFRVAGQIKLLVDTPEQIWHSLESKRYLTACQLYLVARQVFNNLQSRDEAAEFNVMKRFPVVQRQWDAVSHFRAEILTGSRQYLRHANLSAQDVCETLAAIILLDRLSSQAYLDELLRARLAAAKATLESARAESDSDEIAAIRAVGKIIDVVVSTFTDIVHVYVARSEGEPEPSGAQSQLAQCLRSLSSGNIAGGTAPSFISNLYSTKTNIHLLSRYLPASILRYSPYLGGGDLGVPLDVLRRQTNAFINDLRGLLRESSAAKHVFGLLVSGQTFGKVLAATLQRLSNIERPSDITDAQDPARSNMEDEMSWKVLCDTVLGKPLSIWHDILRASFRAQGSTLITNAFISLTSQPESLIPPLLAKAHTEARVGDLIWSSPNVQGTSTDTAPSISVRASGLLSSIQTVLHSFENALVAIETDLKPLIISSTSWEKLFAVHEDAKEYQEKIKLACVAAVQQYSRSLATMIQEAHAVSQIANGSSDQSMPGKVYTLLLLARVCRALAQHSDALPRLLSITSAPVGSMQRPKFTDVVTPPPPEIALLQSQFQDLAVQAHTDWINWVVAQRVQDIATFVRCENWSTGAFQTWTWQAVALDSDMSAPDDKADTILLPIQPSGPVICALFKLCEQVHGVASFTIEKRVIGNLLLALSRDLLAVYEQLVRGPSAMIGDKGAMQLVFDMRFILLVVRPSWEGTELEQQLDRQAQGILRGLQERIDAIDMAVSEPLLIQHVERFYQRSYVLIGLLLPLHNKPQEARKLRILSELPNLLPLSSQSKRFIHLPISEGTPFAVPAVAQARVSASLAGLAPSATTTATPTDTTNLGDTRRLIKTPITVKLSATHKRAVVANSSAKSGMGLAATAITAAGGQQSGFFGSLLGGLL